MTYGQKILDLMLQEGSDIPLEKRREVIDEIDQAVFNGRFYVIKNKVHEPIGFLTYKDEGARVFINNCVVFRKERKVSNFLSLRKFFRENFKQMWWESSRRDKLCFVK